MRKLMAFIALVSLPVAAAGAEVDPAAALAAAKSHIASKDYARAVALLDPAIVAIREIANPDQQRQAGTALHFYAAVAEVGLRHDDEARVHLEEAFRLSPGMRAVDLTRYDKRFATLFNRVRSELADTSAFDALYPGFTATIAPRSKASADFREGPALEILGSSQEKREWRDVISPEERERFVSAFWAARDTDDDPEVNRSRETFARRVAFADGAFPGTGADTGALSDRGRVFVLLGEPAFVRRRALNSGDAIQSFSRGSIGIVVGTIEHWYYTREQLPGDHTRRTIVFRFVTHQGIGEAVLQKDPVSMNALASARSGSKD